MKSSKRPSQGQRMQQAGDGQTLRIPVPAVSRDEVEQVWRQGQAGLKGTKEFLRLLEEHGLDASCVESAHIEKDLVQIVHKQANAMDVVLKEIGQLTSANEAGMQTTCIPDLGQFQPPTIARCYSDKHRDGLVIGATVQVVGLQQKLEINGMTGVITGIVADKKRFCVRLANVPNPVSVSAQHLVLHSGMQLTFPKTSKAVVSDKTLLLECLQQKNIQAQTIGEMQQKICKLEMEILGVNEKWRSSEELQGRLLQQKIASDDVASAMRTRALVAEQTLERGKEVLYKAHTKLASELKERDELYNSNLQIAYATCKEHSEQCSRALQKHEEVLQYSNVLKEELEQEQAKNGLLEIEAKRGDEKRIGLENLLAANNKYLANVKEIERHNCDLKEALDRANEKLHVYTTQEDERITLTVGRIAIARTRGLQNIMTVILDAYDTSLLKFSFETFKTDYTAFARDLSFYSSDFLRQAIGSTFPTGQIGIYDDSGTFMQLEWDGTYDHLDPTFRRLVVNTIDIWIQQQLFPVISWLCDNMGMGHECISSVAITYMDEFCHRTWAVQEPLVPCYVGSEDILLTLRCFGKLMATDTTSNMRSLEEKRLGFLIMQKLDAFNDAQCDMLQEEKRRLEDRKIHIQKMLRGSVSKKPSEGETKIRMLE